jgi:hypothetical protein
MEKKGKSTQMKWVVAGLIIILIIVGSAIVILNNKNLIVKTSGPSTDPETGIQNWIEAVNGRNIDRLYDLAPDEIKGQRTLDQFREDNTNNILFKQGNYLYNYTLMDKKQNGTSAQIIAEISLHQPENQGTPGQEIPIFYKFSLFYEHGEWKIWTLKF